MSSLSQNIGLTLPEKKERYSLDIINQNNKIIDDEINKINEKFVEVENKFTALESDCDWKEAVDTFEDIEIEYPNPEDGWTVNVKDTNYTWRYNGEKWIPISANAIPIVTDNISGILNKDDYYKFKQTSLGMQIDGETVYLDKKDGKVGYNTDPERGADTFVPFRNDGYAEGDGSSGGDWDLSKLNFESISFSISSGNKSITIDLSTKTDKYSNITLGNGIFIYIGSVNLPANTSLVNDKSYTRSYTVLSNGAMNTSNYKQDTGILTISSSSSFSAGCSGIVYYLV